MDMKKKLEDTYNPDKQSRKEKVVIGLSGGIDSMVTAYLLKIQKYDLIAVTVINSWDDFTLDPALSFSCHLTPARLDILKEFCNKLGIPHHIIKSTNEFKENVIEPWMADKVLGRFTKPCWNCHESRMSILHQKMKELGAQHMATGHYAKLFRHEIHQTVFVHTSNDELHDQSALLSRLPHELLNSLLLPLSDLNRKEVLKLAENFGVVDAVKAVAIHKCLEWKEGMAELLASKVPKKFIQEGEIANQESSASLGEHKGVYIHSLGEAFEFREDGKPVKGIFGSYSYAEKKMFIVSEDTLIQSKFLLVKCKLSEEVSWLEPIKGFVNFSQEDFQECWIYPKALSSVYIELLEPHKLINGEILTVSKKKGKNSKVYLTGEVHLLPLEPVVEEGEVRVPKVDHRSDF
jgi:tRNA U34 2-thiouridine synthase MnmA/TrmU